MAKMVLKELTTRSREETFHLGKVLGEILDFPLIIFLCGEMGTGKTLFSKGFVVGKGLDDVVTSPTYTMVNAYGQGPQVYHFDLYRLQDVDELYEMGFEDYLNQDSTLLLEWPDLILNEHFEPKLEIDLSVQSDSPDERKIVLKTTDPRIAKALKQV